MTPHRRNSLIFNTAYVPPSATPIRDELRREWRTLRMIVRQVLAAPSRRGWFATAAVVAGAAVAIFLKGTN
jgi:hypothetical protein